MKPLVTILIPNYKTPELTKLCLRLIRKNTDLNKIKVLVVDNDSQDDSLAYLKSLKWIELYERAPSPDDKTYTNHSRALDLLLEKVDTPYVLSIHTDTFVKQPDWLDFLIRQIEKNPNIAGVGSWKLESKPWYRRFIKVIEGHCQSFYYDVTGKKNHTLAGKGDNFFYLRSHCALYRTELLRRYSLGFSQGDGIAGKEIHRVLVEKGHDMVILPSEILGQYVDHINHATQVLNPQLGTGKKNQIEGLKRVKKALESFNAEALLKDVSLDR